MFVLTGVVVSDGYPFVWVESLYPTYEEAHAAIKLAEEAYEKEYGETAEEAGVEFDIHEVKRMKEYYFLVSNNGDGSSSVHWFKSKKNAEIAIREEDQFFDNEDVGTVMAENLQPRMWYDE